MSSAESLLQALIKVNQQIELWRHEFCCALRFFVLLYHESNGTKERTWTILATSRAMPGVATLRVSRRFRMPKDDADSAIRKRRWKFIIPPTTISATSTRTTWSRFA